MAEGLVLHKSVYSDSENVGALPGVISESMPPPAGQTEFYILSRKQGHLSISLGSPLSPLSRFVGPVFRWDLNPPRGCEDNQG